MKLHAFTLGIVAAASALTLGAGVAAARDRISIVGSSTVFPYTQAVAEEFAGRYPEFKAPVVESTGTGGGFKIFCQGVGADHPDINDASRAMKPSEWELCASNGVDNITEAMIGYDGLSVAVSRASKADWDVTRAELFLALAAEVPTEDGKLIPNPYHKWSEINPKLPDIAITVYGPPPTSGTRDAFVELAMHEGCKELPQVKALKESMEKKAFKKWVKAHCSAMRQDGPFIEAGENDNLIVQRLEADPNALGIFGYSFLYENEDKLKAVTIEGVDPSPETIADFSYPISRPLFIYVKNAHRGVIPGLNEFLEEYASEDALGPDGYLVERGLVPLPDEVRERTRRTLLDAVPMKPLK
ncbi:MAG: PstS family phosphate ABC transporter substrate-binding protein [Alphaproteobacteria bacterium]|nr:MAG: PstS family phosphate ABC transporter substrate-binding protein [Alphaproteobacteria bacterium]